MTRYRADLRAADRNRTIHNADAARGVKIKKVGRIAVHHRGREGAGVIIQTIHIGQTGLSRDQCRNRRGCIDRFDMGRRNLARHINLGRIVHSCNRNIDNLRDRPTQTVRDRHSKAVHAVEVRIRRIAPGAGVRVYSDAPVCGAIAILDGEPEDRPVIYIIRHNRAGDCTLIFCPGAGDVRLGHHNNRRIIGAAHCEGDRARIVAQPLAVSDSKAHHNRDFFIDIQ